MTHKSNEEKSMFARNLAYLLQYFKREKGITAKRIASELNIDEKRLSMFKNKIFLPTETELAKLCNYFDVSDDTMFHEYVHESMYEEVPEIKKNKVAVELPEECKELIRLFNNLSLLGKVKLLHYAYKLNGEKLDNQE